MKQAPQPNEVIDGKAVHNETYQVRAWFHPCGWFEYAVFCGRHMITQGNKKPSTRDICMTNAEALDAGRSELSKYLTNLIKANLPF